MKNENTKQHESIANNLIESINQLQKYALGVGPAACQVCGREFREGDGVTAYAFRAAGNPIFEIGYVMCGADEHAHPSVFMRGVHELVVTGRIGLCTDVSVQSSWLVLLAPSPVVLSVASSSSGRMVGDRSHDTDSRSADELRRRDGPMPLLAAVCDRTRADGGDE